MCRAWVSCFCFGFSVWFPFNKKKKRAYLFKYFAFSCCAFHQIAFCVFFSVVVCISTLLLQHSCSCWLVALSIHRSTSLKKKKKKQKRNCTHGFLMLAWAGKLSAQRQSHVIRGEKGCSVGFGSVDNETSQICACIACEVQRVCYAQVFFFLKLNK